MSKAQLNSGSEDMVEVSLMLLVYTCVHVCLLLCTVCVYECVMYVYMRMCKRVCVLYVCVFVFDMTWKHLTHCAQLTLSHDNFARAFFNMLWMFLQHLHFYPLMDACRCLWTICNSSL